MKPEEMTIGTEFGVIKITLCAKDLADMSMLREMMFNWYEDIAEREASLGRAVSTRHTSDQKANVPDDVRSEDIKAGIQQVMRLRSLLDSYIVLRSLDSHCGEVVQIPIRQKQYEEAIWKAYSLIDHVLKRYLKADESRFPDEYPF